MNFKILIFCEILAIALGFTLPEDQPAYAEPEWTYGEQIPAEDSIVLIRRVRSPQRRFDARTDHSRRMGSSASFGYIYPINKNWEAYARGARNFKYNDNSGHAGLRFKF